LKIGIISILYEGDSFQTFSPLYPNHQGGYKAHFNAVCPSLKYWREEKAVHFNHLGDSKWQNIRVAHAVLALTGHGMYAIP